MKYLILMFGDEQRWAAATDAEREAELDAHRAFSAAVAQRATMLGGEALAGADTTTALGPPTHGGQRPVTDGPYAETVEQLGGFYLVQAGDLDLMVDLCQQLPAAYTLEIRPVLEVDL